MASQLKVPAHDVHNASDATSAALMFEPSAGGTLDPVTFEVISHKLAQLTGEQATTLQRTSGSVVVNEGQDFCVTIADARGNVFGLGDFAIVHATALQHAFRWTIENRAEDGGIQEGDMFLLSDPWIGIAHQADVGLLAPVFVEGRLFAWVGNTMHMLDTGGPVAGGLNTAAKDVFSEPAPMPPIRLVRGGVLQREVEEMMTRRSRLPHLLSLDLRAMIAANLVGVKRIQEIAAAYSATTLHLAINRIQDNAEMEFRDRLRELPDGRWSDVQLCEVSGDGDRGMYGIRGTMTKRGDQLEFDVSETDDQRGFFNSTWPTAEGGLVAAVLPLLCPDLTWAPSGVQRAITFKYRPGTIIAATFPAAVSAGPIAGGLLVTSLGTALVSKMLSCASDALKENLFAVTSACIPANFFRGVAPDGRPIMTLNVDTIPGGTGARSWRDGDEYAGISFAPSSRIPNIEHQEHASPFLYLYRRELPDSGGAGRFRGGVSGECAFIPYGLDQPMEMMLGVHGAAMPSSTGLNGGLPAKAVSYRIYRDVDVLGEYAKGQMPAHASEFGVDIEWAHPKISSVPFGLKDVFVSAGSGGGGYGDPLERDPSRVANDVKEGYVSVERARDIYGVAILGDTVDHDRTESLRADIRHARIGHRPDSSPHAPPPAGHRMLSEHVGVTDAGSAVCTKCGTDLSRGTQDFKAGATMHTVDMLDAGLVWVHPSHFIDEELALRQYSCPGCGTLLETELAIAREPIKSDRELFTA
ncbi:hydantoinase B/oxoprolinase family protein [Sphingobium subterraneum]|uniref:N-methylhydantoinase B n=1 Tax=Sphingobium subterraneum TaxID=627688 RepID=A0A841IXN9_9SPHN|nr:hydantoinase B/oxoprolinase family protein [Sphingobium subterraneum]MBB6123060.1 N-methylhydantoinase B [Sphingobium subterraneum]